MSVPNKSSIFFSPMPLLVLLAMSISCQSLYAQFSPGCKQADLLKAFTEQAMDGIELHIPPFDLTSQAKVGDFGRFRPSSSNFPVIWCEVVQKLDEGDLINIHYYARPKTVWVTNHKWENQPSKTFVFGPFRLKSKKIRQLPEGAQFRNPLVWEATGLFTYETASGVSKTILDLVEVDESEIEFPKHPESLIEKPRVWLNRTGEEVFTGVLIDYQGGAVTLVGGGVVEQTVEVKILCDSDQRFIRDKIKHKKDSGKIREKNRP